MGNTPNYKMPMCEKLGSRASAGSVGHPCAATTRQGMHASSAPTLKTGATKNVDLQPGQRDPNQIDEDRSMSSPSMSGPEGNGFAATELPSNPDDAQSQQTTADPVARETEPAEVIPTTETAPDGGDVSEPTVEGAENPATGSTSEARYPSLIPSATPVGYPGT